MYISQPFSFSLLLKLQHGANCKLTDRNGHAPIDVVPSNQTEGSEGDVTNQMRALLQSAAEAMEMKEREAQVAAAEVEEGEREEGGDEDKENAMEIEHTVVVEKETLRKVGMEGGREGGKQGEVYTVYTIEEERWDGVKEACSHSFTCVSAIL